MRMVGKTTRFYWKPVAIVSLLAVLVALVPRLQIADTFGQNPVMRMCDIKGNISRNGERIYHVPGGKWYEKTHINPIGGERWFCSEPEARAKGWRRSLH
ncbi:MAG: hypothetical protein OEY91_10445 [Nitrospirota bacterium]|nr:hypothetical protein [Nitrospirota bacterium]